MNFIKLIAEYKQRLSYSASWFGLVGTPLLVVNLIQEKLFLINVKINFIILFLMTIIFLLITGYISEKTGIIKHEANWSFNQQEDMKKHIEKRQ